MNKEEYIKKLEEILYKQDVQIKELFEVKLRLLEIIKNIRDKQTIVISEEDRNYVDELQDIHSRR